MSEWFKISEKVPEFPCVLFNLASNSAMIVTCPTHTTAWTHWQPFSPPDPEKSECQIRYAEWFKNHGGGSYGICWNAAWLAATERAARIVDNEMRRLNLSETFQGVWESLAAKIREK